MAVRCNSATDYLTRTTNVPANTAYTIAGWFKRVTDLDAYETAIRYAMYVNPDHYGAYIEFYPSWDGTNNNQTVLRNDTGGGVAAWTTLPGTDNTNSGTAGWYYLALTGDGTNNKAYWYTWNGSSATLVDSATQSVIVGTNQTTLSIEIMGIAPVSRYVDGKCCYVRVWDAALTQTEIETEAVSSVIVRTTNINTALGACTDSSFANDISGNGRNWTLGAGLTTSDFDSDVPSGLSGGGPSNTLMGQACL